MVLAASAFSAYAASKDDGTAAKVAETMNSKTFTINIMTIIPQSGPVEQCSGEYSIRVVDGKADGRLPFRGTSYVAVLGSEDPAIVSCTCMNKSPMNYNGELVFE